MTRLFKFLPEEQRQKVPVLSGSAGFMTGILPKRPRLRLGPHSYKGSFVARSWRETTGDAKSVAQETICRCTTSNYAVSRARMRILI